MHALCTDSRQNMRITQTTTFLWHFWQEKLFSKTDFVLSHCQCKTSSVIANKLFSIILHVAIKHCNTFNINWHIMQVAKIRSERQSHVGASQLAQVLAGSHQDVALTVCLAVQAARGEGAVAAGSGSSGMNLPSLTIQVLMLSRVPHQLRTDHYFLCPQVTKWADGLVNIYATYSHSRDKRQKREI